MKLEFLLTSFQARLRAFALGPELDKLAAELQKRLLPYRRRRADTTDRLELKALALLSEYLDAHGKSNEAAALLRLTVNELLSGEMEQTLDLKLKRQQVWCCLAYAQTHLRANRTREAGLVLSRMHAFVRDHLVEPGFPCHGTIALLRYYEGLWNRTIGRLDTAARHFDAALDQARLRYEEKKQKYENIDADRLRRELVYSRVLTARITGFGHGGIALARGRYVEARGWLIAASQILANLGQEDWRLGLEVYTRSASVLVAELDSTTAERLRPEAERLRQLAVVFATTNPRNAFIAEAFSILAEVRMRQAASGRFRELDAAGLKSRIDACLRHAYEDAGPLSGTAALLLTECLLRAGDLERCRKELERFERVFEGEEQVLADEKVLRAEYWMAAGRWDAARAALEALVSARVANRGSRARAWTLLALCESKAGRITWAERAMDAAQEAIEASQDGFSRALLKEVAVTIDSRPEVPLGMPYQAGIASERWCDMDNNLEVAKLNVIAAVHSQHPGYTVERLAAAVGRGSSWLYALLGKHRDQPWVAQLFAQRKG